MQRVKRALPPHAGTVPRSSSGNPILASLRRRQSEVARERKFEPSAKAVAVENGDHRLRQILDGAQDSEALIEHGLQAAHSRNALGKLFEVHSNGEVLLPGAPNDNRTHATVIRKACDLGLQGIHELEAHSVSRSIVDHERLDGTISFDEQRAIVLLRVSRHHFPSAPRGMTNAASAGRLPPNAHAQRRALVARPPDREVRRRVASDIFSSERRASFTAAELRNALATSVSRTTTIAPSFKRRR